MLGLPPRRARRPVSAARLAGARGAGGRRWAQRAEGWRGTTGRERTG
jgi:hypothetical protein